MNKRLPIMAFVVLCMVAFSGGNVLRRYLETPPGADPTDTEQVKLGNRIYLENCTACHGVDLEGETNWRTPKPDGSLKAPPHDQTGHTWHHPDTLIFEYTKKGGKAMGPADFKSNMPGFEGKLSDREIWAVLSYIKSRWPEKIRAQQERLNKQGP